MLAVTLICRAKSGKSTLLVFSNQLSWHLDWIICITLLLRVNSFLKKGFFTFIEENYNDDKLRSKPWILIYKLKWKFGINFLQFGHLVVKSML